MKKKYRLTADVGGKKRGAVIELTAEKAASQLYASRIASVDADEPDARKEAEQIVSDAQAEAKRIIEAAQAEAMKLAAGGKK